LGREVAEPRLGFLDELRRVWHWLERDAARGGFFGSASTEDEIDGGCQLFAFEVADDAPAGGQLARLLVGVDRPLLTSESLAGGAAPAHPSSKLAADVSQPRC